MAVYGSATMTARGGQITGTGAEAALQVGTSTSTGKVELYGVEIKNTGEGNYFTNLTGDASNLISIYTPYIPDADKVYRPCNMLNLQYE